MFTPDEFGTLLCGRSVIDIDLLHKVVEYEFVSASSPHITYFWAVLESMSQEERRLFLNFVWGRCVCVCVCVHTSMLHFKFQACSSVNTFRVHCFDCCHKQQRPSLSRHHFNVSMHRCCEWFRSTGADTTEHAKAKCLHARKALALPRPSHSGEIALSD